jgi:hypothetical protein
MRAARALRATLIAMGVAVVAAAPAQARDPQPSVSVVGNKITISGKVTMPIHKPPVEIMVLDSHGVTTPSVMHCDAAPDAHGRLPWAVHTTRKMTPPGRYSAMFIWVRDGKPVTRKQHFTVPRS